VTASHIPAVVLRKRDPRGLLRIGCGYCKGQVLTVCWRFEGRKAELELDGYREQDGRFTQPERAVKQRRHRTGSLDDLAAPLKLQWGGFRTVELPIKIQCRNCEWVNELRPTIFSGLDSHNAESDN